MTGQTFADYARRMVFAPLRMSSTSFGWTTDNVKRAAVPYRNDSTPYPLREFSASSAAGLVTTAQDMSAFLLAHCTDKTTRPRTVLKPATLEQMWTGDVAAPALGRGSQYGLGYTVIPAPLPDFTVVGHNGSNTGWKAEAWMLPRQGFGIAILTNAADGKARSDAMRMFREESASGVSVHAIGKSVMAACPIRRTP